MTTVQEYFRALVKNRRAANKANLAASGIAPEYGELEIVLDIVIDEVDARKHEDDINKEAQLRKEEELKKI